MGERRQEPQRWSWKRFAIYGAALAASIVGGLPSCSLLAPDPEGIVGERDASASTGGSAGSGGSAGAGGTAGQGSGGASPDCGAPVTADYEIRRIPIGTTLNIDGVCNEPAWQSAPSLSFEGPSNSDNTASCKFLWDPSGSPRFFGCCPVQDTDLRGSFTAHDSKVFLEDSIEYFLRPGTEASLTTGTVKLFISLIGTVRDVDFPGWKEAYDANAVAKTKTNGTLNGSSLDQGYNLEWSSALSAQALTTPQYRCVFGINDADGDPDAGGTRSHMLSFKGTLDNGTNNTDNWGSCYFSCLESGQ